MTTVLENLTRLEKSEQALVKNMGKLMKEYPDKYVAIADGQVIVADSDLDRLLTAVKSKVGTTEGVLIDYISSKQSQIVV